MTVRTDRPALRGLLLMLGADWAWTEQCMQAVEPTLASADRGKFVLDDMVDVPEALRLMRLALGAEAVRSVFPISAKALREEMRRHETDRTKYGCPFVTYVADQSPAPPFHEALGTRLRSLMDRPADRPGNPCLAQAITWWAAQIAAGKAVRAALPEIAELTFGDFLVRVPYEAIPGLFTMAARRDREGFQAAAAALELGARGWPPIGQFPGSTGSWMLLTK